MKSKDGASPSLATPSPFTSPEKTVGVPVVAPIKEYPLETVGTLAGT